MPAGGFRVLDNPLVWNASRAGLDLAFGLGRKRIARMREWGLLENWPSVIDVGCGTGSYARMTRGRYLGMDRNERYIQYARSRQRDDRTSFRVGDVSTLVDAGRSFDLALMVDFLHHIPEEAAIGLLRTAGHIAKRHVVNFEPVTEQNNPVGDWFIKNDRGDYMRSTESLMNVFARAADSIRIVRREPLQLGPIFTLAILSEPVGCFGSAVSTARSRKYSYSNM
jgi:SAM-dependent methyltransferase